MSTYWSLLEKSPSKNLVHWDTEIKRATRQQMLLEERLARKQRLERHHDIQVLQTRCQAKRHSEQMILERLKKTQSTLAHTLISANEIASKDFRTSLGILPVCERSSDDMVQHAHENHGDHEGQEVMADDMVQKAIDGASTNGTMDRVLQSQSEPSLPQKRKVEEIVNNGGGVLVRHIHSPVRTRSMKKKLAYLKPNHPPQTERPETTASGSHYIDTVKGEADPFCISENNEGQSECTSTTSLTLTSDERTDEVELVREVVTPPRKRKVDCLADLGEKELVAVEDIMELAGGDGGVRTYLGKLIEATQHPEVHLQQRGRHMIRLVRDAGMLDSRMYGGAGPSRTADLPVTLPLVDTLKWLGTSYPQIAKELATLAKNKAIIDNGGNQLVRLIKNLRSSIFGGTGKIPALPHLEYQGVCCLLRRASRIDTSLHVGDEQDLRLAWAAITQESLTNGCQTEVSLEFRHEFVANKAKSDVTLFVEAEGFPIGYTVLEIQKADTGPHKRSSRHPSGARSTDLKIHWLCGCD
ncbi:hypothetical protein BC832DRAFT_593774 [Gaertneriomyces semiglobifer]|nr:hypothetical protein BC832DRAFT_593774 [Gaertneriomyces semiglobifer]